MVLVRRRNGEPMRNWGIAAAVSLLLVFTSGSVSDALYGEMTSEQAVKDDQQTSSEQTTEELNSSAQGDTDQGSAAEEPVDETTAQEATNDEADQPPATQDQEGDTNTPVKADKELRQTPQPQPQTVEELINARVKKASYLPVQSSATLRAGTGCYNVAVRFNENPMQEIEWLMEDIYAGLYNDPQLTGKLCKVTINAYGDIRTVGQKGWHKEKVYMTSLDAAAANTVNWKKDLGVNTYSANNLKQVWTTHYVHPATRQARKEEQAREQLKRNLDCLYDEGLFDVDVLCP